jgi:hypothetical protein
MTATAAAGTTHPADPCPHLDGQCTEPGSHDLHWGADNTIPAIRSGWQPPASARLFSCEDGAPETEPTLSLSYAPFDGDLTLHELDQHIAGLDDYVRTLRAQAVQLAAARRQWEAQQ